MSETGRPAPPVLRPLPKLRRGYTVADACRYAGVDPKGKSMDEIRKAVTQHAAENDPRRRMNGRIETVEQAQAAITHWATAPYEGCGNYGLGMTTCEAVNMNGDCLSTKFCAFAETTREAVGRDSWDRSGFSRDASLDEWEILDLCPYWDPESPRAVDNTADWFEAEPEEVSRG